MRTSWMTWEEQCLTSTNNLFQDVVVKAISACLMGAQLSMMIHIFFRFSLVETNLL